MAELVSIKRNVDVSPGQAAPAVFHCSQGDVGSKIILGLLNNGTAYAIPSGVTVTIEGSESNGSIFTPISATASGSDITFYLTGEMTAVAGPAICQAVLKSGSNILGTANFTLEVESSPMGADAPPVFTDAGWTWMLNKLNTEFVSALGDNIIDAIEGKADQSDLTALSNAKLDKNQGTTNAGKYLKVGANGNVETAGLDVTTDKTLSIADKAADAKAVGDELDDLKADLYVSRDFTRYFNSANGNYLNPDDLDIIDKFINPQRGFLANATGWKCGYVRIPCPGNYKLLQPAGDFGNSRLYVPLYTADKTYINSISATSIDSNVISFEITESIYETATFIAASYNSSIGEMPMLLLDSSYPTDYKYIPPYYTFIDFNTMRMMGKSPLDINSISKAGWYNHINSSTMSNLPSNFSGSAGVLLVLPKAHGQNYGVQILFDADNYQKCWHRIYELNSNTDFPWSQIAHTQDLESIKLNRIKIAEQKVSLSGNYFDYNKAEWLPGFDTGQSITTMSGCYHAFAELPGPGSYIRVMRSSSFGTNCKKVALYDKNKNRLGFVSATRIGETDGFTFTLTEEQALTARYTTMNRESAFGYVSALFYNSDQYPLKAGTESPLPNYKPTSLPLYKSIFVCDGDSIGQGIHDKPLYRNSWWGRIVTDYSANGKNYSIGGGTITSGLYYGNEKPRHWICENIDTIHNEYETLDYLILEGGTNDADLIGNALTTLPSKYGTWTETDFSGNYDDTTFCGAVETLFYKSLTYYPRSKIGFIIPMEMGTTSTSIANRRKYFDEIKKIANKWHIPVLDLWEESQLDARLAVYYDPNKTGDENVTAKSCYYDGQHPTSYGYDMMHGKIDAWINSL